MARILIVDDEPGYRRGISRLLSRDGHEVCTAATGEDALELATTFRPTLLIVDSVLGSEIDGHELAARLSRDQPQISIIVISGYPAAILRGVDSDSRIVATLTKPFEPGALRTLVREVLENEAP